VASPYLDFDRGSWAALRVATPLTLGEADLAELQGINERVSLEEVETIYLPLSRLLNLHVSATQTLHTATDTFLGSLHAPTPYVIGVAGSVAVSGVVRGQVTLATTGNILLADDLTYVTSPGSVPDCDRNGGTFADILGLLTPEFFVIEDNNVNSPFRAGSTAGAFGGYLNQFDESADETVHAAVLTLNSVLSEDITTGATNRENCAGSTVGRGCFNMVGAAIQGVNAARMSSAG
jgi:hypothetical protein